MLLTQAVLEDSTLASRSTDGVLQPHGSTRKGTNQPRVDETRYHACSLWNCAWCFRALLAQGASCRKAGRLCTLSLK